MSVANRGRSNDADALTETGATVFTNDGDQARIIIDTEGGDATVRTQILPEVGANWVTFDSADGDRTVLIDAPGVAVRTDITANIGVDAVTSYVQVHRLAK